MMPRMNAEETADAISHYVNSSSSGSKKLAEIMVIDHPTLQQGKMRLFVEFVRQMAKIEFTDARNEASVKLAKSLVEQWGDGPYLPYI
jgi:hypothetical protein